MTTPPPPPPGYGPPPPGAGGPYGGAQLASWGLRAGAYLVDLLIIAGLAIVVIILGAVLGSASHALGVLVLVAGYVGVLAFVVWQLIVQGQTGQTIGKKQVGIKLVRESDGQFIGAGLSVGRYFVHIVDSLACYLGWLWPLWDAKKQTFADKILATLVIKA